MAQIYNSAQAAAQLGVSRTRLYQWRWILGMGHHGHGPVRMTPDDIVALRQRFLRHRPCARPAVWQCCGWVARQDTNACWTCPDCQRMYTRTGAAYAADAGD